jgi:hypothetical protein
MVSEPDYDPSTRVILANLTQSQLNIVILALWNKEFLCNVILCIEIRI